jgi:hypothetical protein
MGYGGPWETYATYENSGDPIPGQELIHIVAPYPGAPGPSGGPYCDAKGPATLTTTTRPFTDFLKPDVS